MVGGVQASEVFDVSLSKECIMPDDIHCVDSQGISGTFINERLGTDFSNDEIADILRRTEFMVEVDENGCEVYSPFWRTDIDEPEDIVEEVGRLHGFDKLPRQLPMRSIKPAPKNQRRELKNTIRQSLSRAGANEVLTYSFVHENIFKKSGKDASRAYKISNALSPDLQYYRTSILPSLLDKVHMNIKAGHDEFMLFEIGKIHDKELPLDDDNLPRERSFVDAVYASKKPCDGAAYYQVRRMIERILGDIGVDYTIVAMSKAGDSKFELPTNVDSENISPFDWQRSAWIMSADGKCCGMVGELTQAARRSFKLPDYTAAFSIDLEQLECAISHQSTYQPLSRYPSISQDISLKVSSDMPYSKVYDCVTSVDTKDISTKIAPVVIYQPKDNSSIKTITLRLTFTSMQRTLSDKDIAPIMAAISQQAKAQCAADTV